MKYITLLFMFFLGGCALFKPSLQSQLEPLDMTFVEGGTFIMGDVIEEKNEDSLPLHEVSLPDFYIGTFEVTYRQYDAFANATGKELPRDDGRGRGERAVIFVNWYDALEFCNAYGYRLPTEKEWEYASRSGGKKEIYAGTANRESLDQVARHKNNSGGYTFLVGTKEPNGLGLYDMSGNVAEYIGEYYPFYKTNLDSIAYYPLDERAMRIVRGGSFNAEDDVLRTYWRVGVLAELEDHTIGFRCVDPAE